MSEPVSTPQARASLVVVEDDAHLLDSLTMLLRRSGHDVRKFLAAEEALESCRVTAPDVLLTDINMPGMNGLELTEAIRRAEIPTAIILMTANTDCDLARTARELAVLEFIVKPFEPETLFAALERSIKKIHLDRYRHDAMDKPATDATTGTAPSLCPEPMTCTVTTGVVRHQ